MRWSMKTVLTLTFILLASLPLLGSGYLAINYLSTRMGKEISGKNLLLANSLAREIERFLDQSFSRLDNLAHLIETGSLISSENLDNYLELTVSSYSDLELVRVLDSNGIVINLAPFDKNIFGLDMSRQAYCIKANQKQSAYWSNVFISPQTGASTLALAIPFKGGMVVGHLSLFSVRDIIDSVNIGSGASVAVVDNYGTAIAHQNQSLVAQRSYLSNNTHIAEGLAGQEGNFRHRVDGEAQIGSVATINDPNWVVAVSQSLDEMFLPIENLKDMIYLATMSAVAIAVLAALFSLGRILSPLKSITQNARRISKGDYTIEPVKSFYSEIIDLEESFKTMIHEVKDREADILESEERFRSTFEQAAVGIAHVSTEGRFLLINTKFCDIVGYSQEELLKLGFQDITHPDDLENDVGHVQRLLQGIAETYSLERRYIRRNGEPVWVNLTVSLVKKENGESAWFVAVIDDISGRKKAQLELRQAREYTDHLIQTANMMIIGLDANGRMTLFNPAAESISGYSFSELRKANWFETLVPKERYPEVHDEFHRLLKGGVPKFFENPIVTKEGRERYISWSNNEIIRNGEIVGITSFGVDITERMQAEQKLRDSEAEFRSLMEQSPISIQVINPDGQISKVNKAFQKIWGISDADLPELLEKYNVLEDEEAEKWGVMPLIRKAFEGEPVTLPVIEYDAPKQAERINLEHTTITKCWIQARFYPVKNAEGDIINIVGLEEDMTEQKWSEIQLQAYQQQLKALVSQLTVAEERERRRIAADLHDDVGQTLAFSRIQIAILKKKILDTENLNSLDEISEILKKAIQDTRELVFDLSSPLINELGLVEAVAGWLEEKIKKRYGIKSEIISKGEKKYLNKDLRGVLFRNIRELLTNVVKHASASEVSVQFEYTEKYLKILVADNGNGFEPGLTAHQSNQEKQFGLFSIEERMAGLGGFLQIESEPGKGTNAVLSVPVE